MINLIFFDDDISSKQNGIGTFRDQLMNCLKNRIDVHFTLVSLNSETSEICHTNLSNSISQISFPIINDGNWRVIGPIIATVLSFHIPDNENNAFIVNHSPCVDFISSIKQVYQLSKFIFVIHDQGWCSALLGSDTLLRTILNGNSQDAEIDTSLCSRIQNYCFMEAQLYNMVDLVVCLSVFTAKIVNEIYGISMQKIKVIPNGFTSRKFNKISKKQAREKLKIALDDKIIVYAGRASHYKGIEPLMSAIKILREKESKIKCVFCGPIDGFAAYSSMISQIASSLIFTGFLSKEELHTWFCAADLGIIPSYSEQFGYSAIEMADSGLLMVVSDCNGLREIFQDGKNCFAAQIGQDVFNMEYFSKNIAHAIEQALTASKDVRSIYKKNIREFIKKGLSAEQMALSYLEAAEKLTYKTSSSNNFSSHVQIKVLNTNNH